MSQKPARPRTRRRPRRWWLFPLAVAIAIGVALKTDLAARIAGTTVQSLAEAALGEEVTVGGVSVEYFPPEVALDGVVVAGRTDGQRILGARRVVAAFGFVGWVPGLVRLTVDSPSAHLHLDADGLREFRDARRSDAPAPESFPWHELVVIDGHLLVEGQDLRVELSDLDVAPEADGALDLSFHELRVDAGTIHERSSPTRFKHVRVSPHGVDAPDLDVLFEHLHLDGAVRLDDRGPLVADLSLRVGLPAFTTNADDPRRYVDGVVDLDLGVGGSVQAPVVTGALRTQNLVLWRVDSADAPAALRLGEIVGPLRWEAGVLTAEKLELDWGEGSVDVRAVVDTDALTLEASVLAEGVHLGRVLRQTGGFTDPWVDFEADVEANVTGTLDPFRLTGPFEVLGHDLVVRNGPYDSRDDVMLEVPRGRVLGTLALDGRHIVLDADDVRFGPGHGVAYADIGFESYGPLRLRTELRDLDLGWLQPLGGAGLGGAARVEGTLEGRFDALYAEAELVVADPRVLDLPLGDHLVAHLESDLGRLDFTGIHGRFGPPDAPSTTYVGNYSLVFADDGMWMDTQLVVPEGRVADLTGIFVDLPGVDGAVRGSALLHGAPTRLSGEVHLEVDDAQVYGEKFDSGEATAWMDDGILAIDDLTLRREVGSVLVRGSVGRLYAMNLEVLTDGLRLEALDVLAGNPVDVHGELVADVRIGGTLTDWEPAGRLVVQRAQVNRRNVDDSVVEFSTAPGGALAWTGRLLGDAALLRGNLHLYGEQPYDVHARLHELPLHVFYPDGADGSPVTATITGEVDLAGSFGDDPTPVDLDARFSKVRVAWGRHDLRNPEEWVLALHGTSLQVPGLSLVDGTTRVALEGWTTADGRANFRGGGQVDLDLARAFAPGLLQSDGVATVDLAFGTNAGPTGVSIDVRTRAATVRTDYFPGTFSELEAQVHADGRGYDLRGVRAVVGGGRLDGGGTIAAADGWWPSAFDLQAHLEDAQIRYFDYLPSLRGDADLRFDGEVGDLLLAGDITLREMVFRDRVDWEGNIVALQSSRLTDGASEAREDYFSMDLAVHAAETVRLRNNLADAVASAELRVVGDTARPGMVGTVEVVPGGHMYLQDRDFEVARATLRFLDPYTFDPDLDIQLESDISGREQDYHVYYSVTGPFSDWSTTTTSDPYLSQADINTLLLFGMTREEFEQYGGMAAIALAAQATDLLAAQVATPAQLVDRWNLVSGISARGTPTLDGNWRVVAEKDFFGVTATGELDLADYDLYLAVERQLTRGLYASVYTTSQEEGRTLDFGAAIGTELKYRWELD